MTFDKRAYWQDLLTNTTPPEATAFLGFELIAFDPDAGWVDAAFTLPAQATNPGGDAQGGFVSAMLDEVMSLAGSIVQDGPAMSPTLQMTTSYIRPVPVGQRLIGRGECVRRGRAGIFTQGFLRREDGTLLAQATASCIPRAMPSGT
jgi:uncharacterized protein (TIGR00369 family)